MANKIGYIRVSSKEQNIDRQIKKLEQYNLDKLYIEKISGKDINRPELKKMMRNIQKDDVLYVESLSRLARSLKDLYIIIEFLSKKEVKFISIKENIDLSSATGKLIFNILASLSEFERDIIKERQKEGIEIAKEKGKFKGRKYDKINEKQFKNIVSKLENEKISVLEAYTSLKMTKSKFYRRYNRYKKTGIIN